ncbi:MAG: hypothetical protein II830_00805 [Alphaproteobacteria bacterium]|nr:hypothetical protein [Alphaproteobacteria bacterium]
MTFWDRFKKGWKSQTPWEKTKSLAKATALSVGLVGVCAVGGAVAGGAGVALALLGTGAVAYGVDAVKTYKKAKSIKKDMSIPKDKKSKMLRKLVNGVSIGNTIQVYNVNDLFEAKERVENKVGREKNQVAQAVKEPEARGSTVVRRSLKMSDLNKFLNDASRK